MTQGVYVGQRLSFGIAGKARSQTVTQSAIERADLVTPRLPVRAPRFYPNNLLVRIWRGVRREAHKTKRPEMAAPVKPSQQPGTEFCGTRGPPTRRWAGTTASKRKQGGNRPQRK